MNEKYKEFFTNLLLPFSWLFILIFCCFLFASTSHAETVDGSLPFKFSSIETYNTFGNPNNLGNDIITSINAYGLPVFDSDYVLILRDIGFYSIEGNYNIYRAWFWLVPIDSFTSYTTDFYTQGITFSKVSNKDSYFFGVHFDIANNGFTPIVFNVVNNPNYENTMFGRPPQVHSGTGNAEYTYTIFAPYYFNKDFFYNSNYVLDFTGGSSNIPGSAVPNIIAGLIPNVVTGNPITKPTKPTMVNYTWNTYTPPTFDDSSVLNAIKSIGEILSYVATYITTGLKGEFTALTTNLENWVNYIVDSVEAGLNSVIQAINDLSTSIYNNFKSLFEPMFQAINYIAEPVSGTVIYDNISGTSLIQSINTVDTALTTFQGTFTGLSEPNSFVIPIHLEFLSSSWFGTQTTQYLDLSWINSDMRTLIRGFMWAIITYALFITIVDSIANYINGGGDES